MVTGTTSSDQQPQLVLNEGTPIVAWATNAGEIGVSAARGRLDGRPPEAAEHSS